MEDIIPMLQSEAQIPYHVHNGIDSPKVNAKDLDNLQVYRVSTQFDKTTDTILATVTGLTANVSSPASYAFETVLFVNADATGGSKYAISGTCLASAIIYEILLFDDSTKAFTVTSRQITLGGNVGQAGTTAGLCLIKGLITTSRQGTLTIQFAQTSAQGTSSVLVGSYFKVQQIS